VAGVLASGSFVLGPNVSAFEREVADHLGVSHAVGVACGTDALHLALRAVGVGVGDEVITTPFTFVATGEAIRYTGATPVFADIDPGTFTLDPRAVERAIGPRTRAVLPVHLYGHPADLDALRALCDAHGLRLIEDAAQAFGASLGGRRVGGIGDLGCFSFYPSKNLGAFGDGGMVVTNDGALAERVRLLRQHGHVGGYRHVEIGFNSRLDELQAAVLRVKRTRIDTWNERRNRIAISYHERLSSLPVSLPSVAPGADHVWHQYTIRTSRRDALRDALREQGVASVVYYPIPLHRQPAFVEQGDVSLPEAEHAAAEVLSLPMHPHLTDADVDRVCDAVRRVFV
jgi:dTDP-4-amino-4,6-dideoxygalactose transaminase